MSNTHLINAFREVCNEATESETRFVSLYSVNPFYGGPEEGGWWGQDSALIAAQAYPTTEQAEAAKAKLDALAEKLMADAQREHDKVCAAQLDACGWDGEAAQERYGEVDGAVDYFVVIEEVPGSQESLGCRHYE